MCGTCRGREKTSLQSPVGVHSLPARLDCFFGYLLWRLSCSTFLSAELYCPSLKKRQIKNLQGSPHHWPLTATLRELILHGSICLGAKMLIKICSANVKHCTSKKYTISYQTFLFISFSLPSCFGRWLCSLITVIITLWDTLDLGGCLQVKSK